MANTTFGLAAKVEYLDQNNNITYIGISGISFSSDESTITLTGVNTDNNFNNSITLNMFQILTFEIFHRILEYSGDSVGSPSE